jgi:hypothetical protein
MAELPDAHRRQLIGEYVTRCTVNRSHLGIAQLLAQGVVDRVLTTNFDPLVVRACAMVGEFPAVYDCAITPSLAGVAFHPKAVFYLHGQWSGLKLHNVEEDLRKQAEVIRPVLSDLQKDRTWIIVGYSGRSDPLVEVLADAGEYPCGLFWAAYRSSTPDQHVCDTLLAKPEARVLFGFDADTLFERLATDLNCYPPLFVSSPCKYLRNIHGVCREGHYTVPPDEREPVKFEPSAVSVPAAPPVSQFDIERNTEEGDER